MSSYLMVSFHSQALNNANPRGANQSEDPFVQKIKYHDWWDCGFSGKIYSTIHVL